MFSKTEQPTHQFALNSVFRAREFASDETFCSRIHVTPNNFLKMIKTRVGICYTVTPNNLSEHRTSFTT